jgi:hypothetical protein
LIFLQKNRKIFMENLSIEFIKTKDACSITYVPRDIKRRPMCHNKRTVRVMWNVYAIYNASTNPPPTMRKCWRRNHRCFLRAHTNRRYVQHVLRLGKVDIQQTYIRRYLKPARLATDF